MSWQAGRDILSGSELDRDSMAAGKYLESCTGLHETLTDYPYSEVYSIDDNTSMVRGARRPARGAAPGAGV